MEKKQYLTDGEVAFLPVSEEYLTDESGGMGWAERICFPTNAGEACLALERARQAGLPVTVQGSRTGICGGALPQGGLVLNLSRMSGLSGEAHPERKELLLTVQAGVTLSALRQFLDGFRKDGLSYWFPPNPTEEQATLGGIMACRAEGGRAAFWGPAETWLVQVEAADFAGKLRRFQGGELERILGDEGHNWVILSLELRLPERPAHTDVLLCPFEDMSGVSRFLERKDERTGLHLSMAEWLGVEALDLLSENAEALAKAGVSGLQRADTLLLEFTAPGEEEALNGLEELLGLLEECGCDVDGVLMGDSPKERERLLALRHLLNETAAGKARMAAGAVGRPPLLLDLAFPQGIEPFVAQCRRQAAGPWAAWGHGAAGHVHVHLFYENEDEYARQRETAAALLEAGRRMGGVPHREFGRGKCRTADGSPVEAPCPGEGECVWTSRYV